MVFLCWLFCQSVSPKSLFVDWGGFLNKLVPASWHESALQKGLPDSINVGDGWVDQYLAGYVWNQPVKTYAQTLGMKDDSLAGALSGNAFAGVFIPAVIILSIVYIFWVRKNYIKKLRAQKGDAITFKDHLGGFWSMVIASKRTSIAGLLLGIACGLQMFVIEGLRMKFGVKNAGLSLNDWVTTSASRPKEQCLIQVTGMSQPRRRNG